MDPYILGLLIAGVALAFQKMGKRGGGMSRRYYRGASGGGGGRVPAGGGPENGGGRVPAGGGSENGGGGCGCGGASAIAASVSPAESPTGQKSWAPAGWSSSALASGSQSPLVINPVTGLLEGGAFGN